MFSRVAKQPKRKRWLLISLSVLVFLLIVYSIAGFWILPRVLQSRIPDLVADQLPVRASVGQIELNPFLLTAAVRDLTIQENDGEHLVGFKELTANLQLSSIFRWAVILKEVRLTEPELFVRVLPDGRINVLALLDSLEDSTVAEADKSFQMPIVALRRFVLEGGKVAFSDLSSKTPFEATLTPGQVTVQDFTINDRSFQLDRVEVKNAGIELQDRSLSPPVPLNFGPVNLSAENLNNRENDAASIALDVRDGFGGRFDISGQVGINPAAADLQIRVTNAAAEKLEPYVRAFADVDVVSGTANVDGRIKVAAGGSPKLQFKGGMRVDDMEIFIPDDQRDLMKFASLTIDGVQMDLEPNKMQIAEIVIDGLRGNLVVEPDGSLNVNRVVASVKEEASEIAGSLPARLVQTIKKQIQGPVPLHIDAMRVTQASASFEDRSLKPNFEMTLENVEGEMTDVSTVKRTPVKVKIGGKADASSPLRISGNIVPFGEKTDMDMSVSLKRFRLRSISPYASKHAGYTIEKGQMSLALEYKLTEDIIDGKNEIFLQQLTLGERTDSPDAIPIPVDLAVALLKDAEGNIRLNIPVRGNINDPTFSVGNVFADTLIKFVTGIVSSPFKVMEGLSGAFSTEELDRVRFAPGSSVVEDDQVEKLIAFAEALQAKPSLQVEITGRADRFLDGKAMVPEDAETAPDEPPAVEEEQLQELARQRAQSVRDALVLEGKIESGRVKILPEQVVEESTGGQVTATLSLTAD
jgi:outer membrane protein OmpA-like peptidoglycan-associated protein